MTAAYSRTNPSPRYLELIELYSQMHMDGDPAQQLDPEEAFDGRSLPRHANQIKALIEGFRALTILDYGSGKGKHYQTELYATDGTRFENMLDFWNVESVTCYDPGYIWFSTLPERKFDGVICTDVLEHCPEEDIPWILDELFSFADKFVFANVACYPARKSLPNGENAHCTVKSIDWWKDQIEKTSHTYPTLGYRFFLDIPNEGTAAPSFKQAVLQNVVFSPR